MSKNALLLFVAILIFTSFLKKANKDSPVISGLNSINRATKPEKKAFAKLLPLYFNSL